MDTMQMIDRISEYNDITRKIEEIIAKKDCRLHGVEIRDVIGDLVARAFIALVREFVCMEGRPYTPKRMNDHVGSMLTTVSLSCILHELRKEKGELERYAIITIMDPRDEATKKEMLLMYQSFSQLIEYLEKGANPNNKES